MLSRYVRSRNDRFQAGQCGELPGLSVAVETLDAQGDPEQVLYEFAVPLEDPCCAGCTGKRRLRPLRPPALGETEKLPPARGIFG